MLLKRWPKWRASQKSWRSPPEFFEMRVCKLPCATRAQALTQRACKKYSKPFTPPNVAEWGWGCQSAARLSATTADVYGQQGMTAQASLFTLLSRRTSKNVMPHPRAIVFDDASVR